MPKKPMDPELKLAHPSSKYARVLTGDSGDVFVNDPIPRYNTVLAGSQVKYTSENFQLRLIDAKSNSDWYEMRDRGDEKPLYALVIPKKRGESKRNKAFPDPQQTHVVQDKLSKQAVTIRFDTFITPPHDSRNVALVTFAIV